jgi:acyl carrier protein
MPHGSGRAAAMILIPGRHVPAGLSLAWLHAVLPRAGFPPPIAEVHMSSVREKLNEIIAEFAGIKTEDVAKADTLSQIEVDSITMLGIVDEIEEHFDIKIDVAGDFNFDMTMNDFVALIDGLVAKKNA